MERYSVVKVIRESGKQRILETGMIESDAQTKVQEDKLINPNATKYMLFYRKES